MVVAQPSTPYRNDGWLEPGVSDFTIIFQSQFAEDGQAIVKCADGVNVGGIRVGNAARRSGFEIHGLGFDGNEANQSSGTDHTGLEVVDGEKFWLNNIYATRTHPYHVHNDGGTGVRAGSACSQYTISNVYCYEIGDRAVEAGGEFWTVRNVYNENGFDRTVAAIPTSPRYGTIENIMCNTLDDGSHVGFSNGTHINVSNIVAINPTRNAVLVAESGVEKINVSNVLVVDGTSALKCANGRAVTATNLISVGSKVVFSDGPVDGLRVTNAMALNPNGNVSHGCRFTGTNATNIRLSNIYTESAFRGFTVAGGDVTVSDSYFSATDGQVVLYDDAASTFVNCETEEFGTTNTEINANSKQSRFVAHTTNGGGRVNFGSAILNREAVESANAESPQGSYPTGTFVRFTDSGDGSGTGTYFVTRSGGTIPVASSA
jgi:hypothetical protein